MLQPPAVEPAPGGPDIDADGVRRAPSHPRERREAPARPRRARCRLPSRPSPAASPGIPSGRSRHQLLSTTHGDLDCLGSIDDGKIYEDLLARTVEMRLGKGLTVRVLGLAALLDMKERAGRPKDLAAIPVLRATLDEIKRRS